MTETDEVRGYLESNRDLLRNPFQVDSLLQNAKDSLIKSKGRLTDIVQFNSQAESLRQNMPAERRAEMAERPTQYIQKDVDFWTRMVTALSDLRTKTEPVDTIDDATKKAQMDFVTYKSSFYNKLGERSDSEFIIDDATSRGREAAERVRANPEDIAAKRSTEYWAETLKLAQGAHQEVYQRTKERVGFIQMMDDGETKYVDLAAEQMGQSKSGQLFTTVAMGMGGVVLFLLWRKYKG